MRHRCIRAISEPGSASHAGFRRIISAAQRGHLNGVEASIQVIPRCSLRRFVVDDIGRFGAVLGAKLAQNTLDMLLYGLHRNL